MASADIVAPQPPSTNGVTNVADGNNSPAKARRQAWNVPVNDSPAAVEVSVMGAHIWPALSESTRTSPKSSPSTVSTVIPSCPGRPDSDSLKSRVNMNHRSPVRQKSMKWGGINGSSGLSNGAAPAEMQQAVRTKQPAPEQQHSSGDSHIKSSGSSDHGSKAGGLNQNHGGSEQQRGYGNGGGRRSNGGSGSHYINYGSQDRGMFEWNHRRSFNGRDGVSQNGHHQARGGVRPFVRPGVRGLPTPPFVVPYGTLMGFPDMASPVYCAPLPSAHPNAIGAMPYVPPAGSPAMFFLPPDPALTAALLKQIEFYFSYENLCRDTYLRMNMDDQGWVPISLIAGFNRVKELTNSEQYILDTVRFSKVVEVQGNRIRKRNDWNYWLLPQSKHIDGACSQSSEIPIIPTVSSHLNGIGLEGSTNFNNAQVIRRSSSGNHIESVPAKSTISLVRSGTF